MTFLELVYCKTCIFESIPHLPLFFTIPHFYFKQYSKMTCIVFKEIIMEVGERYYSKLLKDRLSISRWPPTVPSVPLIKIWKLLPPNPTPPHPLRSWDPGRSEKAMAGLLSD